MKICFLLLLASSPLIASPLLISGRVESLNEQKISAPFTTSNQQKITWMADEGQFVHVGDEVLRYDGTTIGSQYEGIKDRLAGESTRSQRDIAKLELESLQAQSAVERARVDHDVAKLLANVAPGVVAELEYEEKQLAKVVAQHDYEQAVYRAIDAEKKLREKREEQKAVAEDNEAQLAFYADMLEDLSVSASIDGYFVRSLIRYDTQPYRVGDQAVSGALVARVQDRKELGVTAHLAETDINLVKVGQRFRLSLDALPQMQIAGILSWINASSREKPQWGKEPWYELRITLDDSHNENLRPGMSVVAIPESVVLATSIKPAAPNGRTNELQAIGELYSPNAQIFSPPHLEGIWQYTISYLAKDGSKVFSGQPVVMFEDQELQTKLLEQKGTLSQKKKELAAQRLVAEAKIKKVELRNQELDMQRNKAGQKADLPKRVLPLEEWTEYQLRHKLAERQLRVYQREITLEKRVAELESRVLASEIDLAQTKVTQYENGIGRMRLRAKETGIVTIKGGHRKNTFSVGDQVWSGRRVAELPDLSNIRLKLEINEHELEKVAVGQTVLFTIDSIPDKEFRAKIAEVSELVREKSRSRPAKIVDAIADIQDADFNLMRPGLRVRATIRTDGS